MSKPPSIVKIINHIYAIHEASKDNDHQLEDNLGYADNNELVIGIRKDMPAAEKRSTLLHEILHACHSVGQQAPLSAPQKALMTDEEWEHRAIYSLENTLLYVLRNNPRVVEYLVGDE